MRIAMLLAVLMAACAPIEQEIGTEAGPAAGSGVGEVAVKPSALQPAALCGATAKARIKARFASSYGCNSSWTDVGGQMYNYGGSCKIGGWSVKILVDNLVQTGATCDFDVARTSPPNTYPVCPWMEGWVLDQSGAVVHLSVIDSTPCA